MKVYYNFGIIICNYQLNIIKMQSKELRQCFIENCKNPLWAKNPLFAILCGHHICRKCALNITQLQQERNGLITHICQKCKTPNELNFKIQDANHHLQADFHLIKKEPKAVLEGKLFTCEDHEEEELKNFCLQDGEFSC